MQRLKDILQTILSLALIAGVTTALYLYTSGYRLQKGITNNIDLTKTGMINAKSVPDSASVYLDGKTITATDNTISGVQPGKHSLKISKKGFVEWSKDIEVFPELVTDITAVLVSQSPRLEPLTNTGAHNPIISRSLTKLAYFSSDPNEPGIYIIPLSGINVSLFRSSPNLAIKDTRITKYSAGKTLEWSPDESGLLVQGVNDIFYLIDLQNNTAQTTASPERVRQTWQETIMKRRRDMMEKLEVDQTLKQLALSEQADWAPDDKKFLTREVLGLNYVYKVYNLEKPLPVGEKIENVVLELPVKVTQPKLSWFPDSFHLIMTEGDIKGANRGVISLIRIDGTNKTEIYSNTLLSDQVYSTRDGDKIIILTSFKSGNQTDLYTIGIR
jgi:hypothetical protein